ncbi:uncharacterized protein LOC128092351 [Culex pipiens pallens]|uniref:uncharacterized protein LOC128092351 n=1 Tax=Culex pipiens pallens TaxID=42434 RepID=UPI0022AB3ABC|nr:uncharacterized protein LOC128092351 [Culex pipiens pallens]
MAAAAKAESEWTEQRTKEGKLFYWNSVTKESVWEKADGFQAEKQPATDKKVEKSSEPGQPTPRVRKYHDHPGGQWVVFFRPKSKPLNLMRIAADLEKHYSGVTEVTKLHRNMLRVALDNAKEANGIVCDPKFCVEYRVWIPARSVEIYGVVSEDHLTVQQVLKGVGLFKRKNLPTVQVIEVRQMGISDGEGENKKFVPTNSYRVTFAGTALPDYLKIGNVHRLPVRLYYPKVMSCSNCQKLGHTKAFCNNKTICATFKDFRAQVQCSNVLLCNVIR